MDMNRLCRDTDTVEDPSPRTHAPSLQPATGKGNSCRRCPGRVAVAGGGGQPRYPLAPSMIAVSTITEFPPTVSTSGSQPCPALPSHWHHLSVS